ncbi:MAG: hypothetical protein FWG01_02540 [Betaproteobacteria bacterium]|nr:hypothetical protein [Betaproteobacteria bacterium]
MKTGLSSELESTCNDQMNREHKLTNPPPKPCRFHNGRPKQAGTGIDGYGRMILEKRQRHAFID